MNLDDVEDEDLDRIRQIPAFYQAFQNMLNNDLLLSKSKRLPVRTATVGTSELCPDLRRYHHFCLTDSRSGKLIVLGGATFSEKHLGSIYSYDFTRKNWEYLNPISDEPDENQKPKHTRLIRSFQAHEIKIKDLEYYLIIGGMEQLEQVKRAQYHSYFVEKETLVWTRVKMKGEKELGARFGHRTIAVPKTSEIYLFGGDNDIIDDNLYLCDYLEREWKVVDISGKRPCARFGQNMVLVDSRKIIMLFGTKVGKALNDCWVYDIDQKKWTEKQTTFIEGRYGAACVKHRSCVYIFGGLNEKFYTTNELLQFDLKSFRFQRIELNGSFVKPIFSCQAVINDENLYIVGGGCSHVVFSTIPKLKLLRISNFLDPNKGDSSGRYFLNSGCVLGRMKELRHYIDVRIKCRTR